MRNLNNLDSNEFEKISPVKSNRKNVLVGRFGGKHMKYVIGELGIHPEKKDFTMREMKYYARKVANHYSNNSSFINNSTMKELRLYVFGGVVPEKTPSPKKKTPSPKKKTPSPKKKTPSPKKKTSPQKKGI